MTWPKRPRKIKIEIVKKKVPIQDLLNAPVGQSTLTEEQTARLRQVWAELERSS